MSVIQAGNTTTTSLIYTGDTTGNLVFTTGGANTVALTIDSAQNITTTNKFSSASMPTGSILQVVTATYSTQVSSTSASYVTTNLTASITPKFSTSKILIIASGTSYIAGPNSIGCFTLFRGTVAGTDLGGSTGFSDVYGTNSAVMAPLAINYIDSPATTSSVTYTVGMKNTDAATVVYLASNGQKGVITLLEIAA